MLSKAFLPALLLLSSTLLAAPVRVESPSGLVAELDASTGRYAVGEGRPDRTLGGELGAPAEDVAVGLGSDRLGGYREIRFRWTSGIPLAGSIRVYDSRPVALFTLTCEAAADRLPAALPRFTAIPAGLRHFSYQDKVFSPPAFALEKNGTPWLLFDNRGDSVIISPAANFMTARMTGDGEREIACGLNDGVTGLPKGFTHRALVVFGHGINATWDSWGRALTDLEARTPTANDADIGLRCLGYWTDNGAFYYYHYDPAFGYAGTLERLVRHYREQGIPIRYLQLDSWWYYKTLTDPSGRPGIVKNGALPEGEWNRYGGLLDYEAHPAVLPDGLAGLEKKVGLPLITHNRWIDPASPYHQTYQISGFAAVDPRWWNHIIGYIADAGVVCYEQDWLNVIYEHSPALKTVPGMGEEFTDGMAHAAQKRGLSLQYCMPLPRYFLQGSGYGNLTTMRVSGDRFMAARWDAFLYTSRLAAAIGSWPWTDVFMSTETDNLLIATLSGGMVGIGDEIGTENAANLRLAARADGVLVKPDVPLLPIDSVYLAEAAGDLKPPMIAATHTDHGALRTAYVFAYSRDSDAQEISFAPEALGLAGEVMVLDTRAQSANRQSAKTPIAFELSPGFTAYYEIAPVGRSGIAFFGDEGKFVSNGLKRIAALDDSPGGLTATVVFAAQEKGVTLLGYAPRRPQVRARDARVADLRYDAATGRFTVLVSPSGEPSSEPAGGDPIRRAEVEFTD